ncbi:MAG: DUF4156 domain-containing protein [Deltaproteobacteria bacterium]|nr:DUF4156 domain-containing protein [Deltaproteobacteria bacterium]
MRETARALARWDRKGRSPPREVVQRASVARTAAVLAAAVVAATACASHHGTGPVTLGLGGSRVVLSSVPRDGCTTLGEVHGRAEAGGNPEAAVQWARNDVRNKAAAMGANFVLLETQAGGSGGGTWGPLGGITNQNSFSIYGTAFRCPGIPE